MEFLVYPESGKGAGYRAGLSPSTPRNRIENFRHSEDGSMIVFSLFIIICMLLAIGLSIDSARYEFTRAKMQSTLDRAVLAAADLEQVLPPDDVVRDYFRKAGLSDQLVSVQVDQGINYRTVSARAEATIGTMFIDMVGINTLSVPAVGTAEESVSDIEIALVLDNSGSMGQNNNLRMNLLKPAARDFIDTVARKPDDPEGTTAISIIPFSTQVTVGQDLLKHYNVTNEHSYSHCVTFQDSDFTSSALAPTTQLYRTAHFDPYTTSWSLNPVYQVCDTFESSGANRDITPWSSDATHLKSRINAMEAKGWTSIEIGTKWGLAMLDPASRPVLNALVAEGKVDASLKNQPFSYNRDNTTKILVVMSDGENTSQWDVKAPYREGNSPLYHYASGGRDYYSYYRDRSGTINDYYSVYYNTWKSAPEGGNSAKRMTWPEVWADMSVKRYTSDIASRALGVSSGTLYDQIVDDIATSKKNTRTSQICKAAKDKGVLVFTIGMDTYGQGDETLSDCASLPTYFYDVRATDIASAFASIALQINQLRLTN